MGKRLDLLGRELGRLTVVSEAPPYFGRDGITWVCKCECGNTKEVKSRTLLRGAIKSCGCLNQEYPLLTTHGMSNTKTYAVWHSMKSRCHNKNAQAYKNYGGRGIVVCKEWLDSFEAFYRDMGEAPEGYTLDRIDNDKGYSKENCKWNEWIDQAYNRRNTVRCLYNGENKTVRELSEILNIKKRYILKNLWQGHTITEIIEKHNKFKTTKKWKPNQEHSQAQ